MLELDELYDRKRNLKEQEVNFFGEEEDAVHYGDKGYQELLQKQVDIETEINELEDGDDF